MTCPRCANQNPSEAAFCSQCGHQLSLAAPAASSFLADVALWRKFIGPRADYYLARFRLFHQGTKERFVPTWHWPAFGVGWLWYLYRKMYLHAAIFLFGGLLPMILGAGLVGVVIWNLFAAITANYLYYMHTKLSLVLIGRRAGLDETARDRLVTDAGGIQPYVWWLGVGLIALAIAAGIMEAPTPITPPSQGDPA
ncbi:MAG TPA: zinc ribbon domain-containing protein [Nitrospirales bacterium]|jgi:hypothetical protein|nr:zinc ribbon domain-containing protein [Nitrospirales bacterium]